MVVVVVVEGQNRLVRSGCGTFLSHLAGREMGWMMKSGSRPRDKLRHASDTAFHK